MRETEGQRFVIVHNIPTPYRLHMFTEMGKALAAERVEMEVWFMARGHPDRKHWSTAVSVCNFTHHWFQDLGWHIFGRPIHFNPGMLVRLARQRVDYLMLGGPWDSLTGIVGAWTAPRRVGIAWYEGNTRAPGALDGLRGVAKRKLLRSFDLLAVPGEEGAAYTELLLGRDAVSRRLVYLPNIVDERLFGAPDATRRAKGRRLLETMGIKAAAPVALWPARLIVEKGILPFLNNLGMIGRGGWQVLLIGDGPLDARIEREVTELGLRQMVIRRPAVSYDEMPALYAAVDLFLLPSLHDPNPLSVVEAMHSGLPVLVSERAGNFPEAVRPGENGWAYRPEDPEQARATLREAFSTPVSRLREMGRVSRIIASQRWDTQKVVGSFIERVLQLGGTTRDRWKQRDHWH